MGYIPGQRYGGPVTSMYHFVEMFGDKYEIKIVCKNHDFLVKKKYNNINSGWNRVGKSEVLYLRDEDFNMKNFFRIIKMENPDVIYSSSIFLAELTIPLIFIAKKEQIPMLLAPRGELSHDRIEMKWWKKKPYLFMLRFSGLLDGINIQATSSAEFNDIIRLLNVKKENIFLVENIPCAIKNKQKIRKKKGEVRIVACSRIQQKNNQLYSIRLVNQMKSKVQFDIYGPKEDVEYWKTCESEILKAPNNISYSYKGVLPLTDIENVYLNYDCLLHPTYSENYGHVIVEAFCHDCPVVISKGTTPWDDIRDFNAGYSATIGDDDAFVNALESIAEMSEVEYSELIKNTRKYARQLQLEELERKYMKMITSICDK